MAEQHPTYLIEPLAAIAEFHQFKPLRPSDATLDLAQAGHRFLNPALQFRR
jgi:hypothetical protein